MKFRDSPRLASCSISQALVYFPNGGRFNEVNFEIVVHGNTQRFQKHWNATKSWIADAEWAIESAPGLINACMLFVEAPQETSSGVDKGNNRDDILIVFKSQLKALKNAIEVQIFECIEQEYQQHS